MSSPPGSRSRDVTDPEQEHFSSWFQRLCRHEDVPVLVAKGAASMMSTLPPRHFRWPRRCTSAVACIRIAYKWCFDAILGNERYVLRLTPWARLNDRPNWIPIEFDLMQDLRWRLQRHFEARPAPAAAVAPKPRRTDAAAPKAIAAASAPAALKALIRRTGAAAGVGLESLRSDPATLIPVPSAIVTKSKPHRTRNH